MGRRWQRMGRKISAKKIAMIFDLHRRGFDHFHIAACVFVCKATVQRYLARKTPSVPLATSAPAFLSPAEPSSGSTAFR